MTLTNRFDAPRDGGTGRSTRARGILAASAAALLTACVGTDPGPPACHGIRCDAIGDLAPRPALVRCSIARGTAAAPAERLDELTCRWTRLAGSTGETSVTINVRGKDFQGGAFLGSMVPDVDHVVLRVHDGDYPLIVQLEHGAQWPGIAGANFPAALVAEQTLAASTSPPIVFQLPYDVWHVRFIGQVSVARGHLDGFPLPVAPFRQVGPAAPADATTFASHVELPLVHDGEIVETWLAVAPGARDLPGQVQLGSSAETPIELAGPGTYVLAAEGLRVATPAEVAEATARPDGGPAGAGPDASGADAGPRDAGFPITDHLDAGTADARRLDSGLPLADHGDARSADAAP